MSFEEPTQRLSTAPREDAPTARAETTTALPRPLDLAGPSPAAAEPADQTGVLSLDEIFDEPAPAPVAAAGSAAEAPTWTAMPVVEVRSEPVTPAVAAPVSTPEPARRDETHSGPAMGERLRADAAAAWDGAVRRSRAWLTRNDNGLMLMTAVVAIVLILVVAALGA